MNQRSRQTFVGLLTCLILSGCGGERVTTSDTLPQTTPPSTPPALDDTPTTSTAPPTVPEAPSPPTTYTDQTTDAGNRQAEEQMKVIEQFRTNWTAMADQLMAGATTLNVEPALKWIQVTAQGAAVVTFGPGAWIESIDLVVEPDLVTPTSLWLHIPYTAAELVSTSKITETPGEAVFLVDVGSTGGAKATVDERLRLANQLAASVPVGVRAVVFLKSQEPFFNAPHTDGTFAMLLETPTGDYTGLNDEYPKLADLPGGFADVIVAANQMQWETIPADLTD